MDSWKINPEVVQEKMRKKWNCQPDNVFFCSPTDYGQKSVDLYKHHNWEETYVTVKVLSSEFVSEKLNSVTILEPILRNDSTNNVTFTPALTQKVQEAYSYTWSSQETTKLGINIDLSLFDLFKVGTTIENSITWGQSATVAETWEVGATYSTSTVVPPKKGIDMSLVATQSRIKAKVVYELTLNGSIALNFTNPAKFGKSQEAHHYYALDYNEIFEPEEIQRSEELVLDIGYHFGAEVRVKDATVGPPPLPPPIVNADVDQEVDGSEEVKGILVAGKEI